MKLFSFWSFQPLSYIERLCLKSMVAAGHPVDLFTFDKDLAVPSGVTVRDAAEILPLAGPVFHAKGSASLFADRFRYRGLQKGIGIWVDMDVILLREIGWFGDHVFGWASKDSINNAILRLPPDSAFFTYIDELVNAPVPIPAHWSWRKKFVQNMRATVGRHRSLDQIERAAIGPKALTHFALETGLAARAQPIEVFYPVHWRETAVLFDPNFALEERFTDKTCAVHLWNARIGHYKQRPPPANSFMARMCERFGEMPNSDVT